MKSKVLPALFLLLLALLIVVMPASAQEGTVTDDQVNEIAKELYCPVCESTPLDVCPTQACADWREVIRTKLSEGQSEEEIKEYFALQYGARALAEPPRQGFTLAVWIVPIVAVVIGAFVFSRYMRRIRATTGSEIVAATESGVSLEPAPSESESAIDDYQARIEQELRERR